MLTVLFAHSVRVDGLWYHVGDQVAFDPVTALRLRNAGYVTILTNGVPNPDATDPFPQYVDERELADALAALQLSSGGGGGGGLIEDPNDPGFYVPYSDPGGGDPGGGVHIPSTPFAPTTFTALVQSDTAITLAWTAAVVDAADPVVTAYRVYNQAGALLRTLGNVTTTTFTGLAPGNTYSFNVTAVNSIGESPHSPTRVVVTTVSPPNAPQNLTTVASSSNTALLTWSAATVPTGAAAVTGYRVYDGSGVLLATLGNTLTYTRTGLTSGGTYSFYVTAFSTSGESQSSVLRTVTIIGAAQSPPNAPTTLTATVTSDTSVGLAWAAATAPSGSPAVTSYRVYQDGSVQAILGVVTSTTITGLGAGSTHTFYVTAVNSVGESLQSPLRTVTTTTTSVGIPGALDPVDNVVFVATDPPSTTDTAVFATSVPPDSTDPAVLIVAGGPSTGVQEVAIDDTGRPYLLAVSTPEEIAYDDTGRPYIATTGDEIAIDDTGRPYFLI